jgi:cytoskeletal protein RodZ
MRETAGPRSDISAGPSLTANIGTALREARERGGLTLEQLSRATKISVPTLQRIEQNDIHELPSRVYVRGFLTAYAREVGLRADDIVQRYFRQFDQVWESAPPVDAGGSSPSPEQVPAREGQEGGTRAAVSSLIPVAIIIGLVALGYHALSGRHAATPIDPGNGPSNPIAALPSEASRATVADRPEAATTGMSDAHSTAAVDGDVLRMQIRIQRDCWVSATADGTRVVYRLMHPAEEAVVEFRKDVIIRVGDAAAVATSIDGRAGLALGRAGAPVTAHITRQNYREFLDPQH